jgi:hypothetical protein
MIIYKPTWLYIKQHNQTGLKYFGKTTTDDPTKYLGSGKYWRRHLAKHGNNVSTLWAHRYDDEILLKEEAMAFSVSHNISTSNEWANLKPETGIDGGGVPGHKQQPTHVEARARHNRGRKHSPDEISKMIIARNLRPPRSEESKAKTANSLLGTAHSEESKQKMRKPKSNTAKVNMAKSWTLERKAAQSERAKAMNAARLSSRQS